ncbi:MAG: DUF2314 domain-containing protein [Alphaproteobacteria bacterium]|nr:DUF2314 domain-containing protein [Alphaproteobacteria bacterium]
MRTARLAFSLLLLALAACSRTPVAQTPEQRFQQDMAAATAEARAHLGYFWRHESAPEDSEYDFRLKVSLPRRDGQPGDAQVWVEAVAKEGGAYSGQLAAETAELPGVERGETVDFTEAQIIDWSFVSAERLYGHYTTRVLLPRMPPERADAMRSMLAENPD